MTLTITTSLPPKCLSPNSRNAWSRRAAIGRSAAKKKIRMSVHLLSLAAWQAKWRDAPRWERATIQPVFYLPNRRGARADADNRIASLKAHADGLADAGIVANDRGLVWLEVRHEVDKANPRLELIVTES